MSLGKVTDVLEGNYPKIFPKENLVKLLDVLRNNNFCLVIDENMNFKGLITKDDLLLKKINVHIPTFLKFFENLPTETISNKVKQKTLNEIKNFKVEDFMNPHSIKVFIDDPLELVLKEFANHPDIFVIPVVSKDGKVYGVITLTKFLKFLESKLIKSDSFNILEHQDVSQTYTQIRSQFNNYITNILDKYIFVRKESEKSWLWIVIITFILGFIAAVLWIIKIF